MIIIINTLCIVVGYCVGLFTYYLIIEYDLVVRLKLLLKKIINRKKEADFTTTADLGIISYVREMEEEAIRKSLQSKAIDANFKQIGDSNV